MFRRFPTAIAIATTLAVSAFAGATPSRADANAPVCATIYDLGGSYVKCDFYNYAQCRATVYGLSGTCGDNPSYRDSLNRMPERTRVRR